MTTVNAADVTQLGQAITTLNSDANQPHTINLTGTSYVVGDADPAGEIFGPSAFPVVRNNITIEGNNNTIQRSTTAGTPAFRMFGVETGGIANSPTQLTLKNLTLMNSGGGTIAQGGAAIINNAPLRLENCVIQNTNGGGNAIYNGDGYRLDAVNTVFINNTASGDGGAIFSSGSSLLYITGCAFIGNIAQRGGAIYYFRNGGSTIVDTSFINNTTRDSNGFDVQCAGGAVIDARYNWWGAGPGPNSGAKGAAKVGPVADFNLTPWRTAPLSIGANQPLPKDLGLKLAILADNIAAVRFGPSPDNPQVTTSPTSSTLVYLRTSANNQYSVYARAVDEFGDTWYGYIYPSRPGVLSWSQKSHNSTIYTAVNPSGVYTENDLPNFTIPGTIPGEPAWGVSGSAPSLLFQHEPFALVTTSHIPFRGFGIVSTSDYGKIPGCRHPGQDFFPSAGDTNGVQVAALADGIVVGIGRDFEAGVSSPGSWGATKATGAPNSGKYNFVIRTGGHFVLYGHLDTIQPWFYLGARIKPGDIIGTLIKQIGNTHLHLEIRTFTDTQLKTTPNPPVRGTANSFGAISRVSTVKPDRAVDPLVFIANKPLTASSSTPTTAPCGSNSISYTADTYSGILVGSQIFSANVDRATYLGCIHIVANSTTVDTAITCTTTQPPP